MPIPQILTRGIGPGGAPKYIATRGYLSPPPPPPPSSGTQLVNSASITLNKAGKPVRPIQI